MPVEEKAIAANTNVQIAPGPDYDYKNFKVRASYVNMIDILAAN